MVALRRTTRSGSPSPRTRSLTDAEVRAIETAMATFIEEDHAFGTPAWAKRRCIRCAADRPAAGFVAYEVGDFCNR